MQAIILEILNRFGYFGVFLLITIENIFPPIPSEVILTFCGFMTISSKMSIWGVIISATLGSVFGAIVLYAFGNILGAEKLEFLVNSKFGRILHLRKDDVKKSEKWFVRYGYSAVFLCRFIPIIRSLISIPAGIAKIEIKKFIFFTTLGTLFWNAILVYLGWLAGEAWKQVTYYYDFYTIISVLIVVLASLSLSIFYIRKRFIKKIS